MLMKPLAIAAAGLAASSSALLLRPETINLEVTAADVTAAAQPYVPETAEQPTVHVSCPNCPMLFAKTDNRNENGALVEARLGLPNHLELSLYIEHRAEGDHLLLNGFELYPDADPFHGALHLPQVPDDADADALPDEVPVVSPIGFGLQVEPVVVSDDEDDYELVTLNLQMFEVASTLVDGLPLVQIKLIRDGDILMLVSANTAPSTLSQNDGSKCDTRICRFINAIRTSLAKLGAASPCHGGPEEVANKGDDQIKPELKKGQMPGHIKGMPSRPGGQSKGFHFYDYSANRPPRTLFDYVMELILLPALFASFVFAVTQGLLLFLVTVFMRRCPGDEDHSSFKADPESALFPSEKVGLMSEVESPPAYNVTLIPASVEEVEGQKN